MSSSFPPLKYPLILFHIDSRYVFIYITNMSPKKKKEKRNRPGWHGRIWLEGEEVTFIGFGRVILLERIRETGSINKAAKSMAMSYRHAWQLLESMNRQAGEALVITCRGGKKGGGSRLTARAEKLISRFWQVHQRLEQFLAEETEKKEE